MWIQKQINTNTPSKSLSGLSSSTTYQWKVRSKCDTANGIYSVYSPIQTFTTPPIRSVSNSITYLEKVSVYPNPTSGIFILEIISARKENNCHIEIYNSLGQSVFQAKIEVNEGENRQKFDLINFPPGIYFLNLKTENDLLSEKILKE